jgi:centromeric protein E
MRPLNSKEHTHHKVWKVLSKYASVAQTTIEGKPLPERIAGRNFFTYDQTFDETSTTQQVYCAVAQPVVTTACTGLNGTIFAYGQTSSGKTYTMQGSGTIAEGSYINIENGGGGIVHMAAHDIFSHITACANRVFVVRASFLEIYNEEVRDLLQDDSGSNKVLQIREDPRRGVFVQAKEMIVTDANGLLGVLWHGEKSRSFASTAMNERSSRSHTIFRITIESRSFHDGNDEDEDQADTGAVRVSTLNLVDLAGSESVRHTGATGDRQKEGGLINQR